MTDDDFGLGKNLEENKKFCEMFIKELYEFFLTKQVTKEEVESNPIFAEFRERSRASTPQIEELRRNSRYLKVAHHNKIQTLSK